MRNFLGKVVRKLRTTLFGRFSRVTPAVKAYAKLFTARRRWLIACDSMAATYKLSFEIPLTDPLARRVGYAAITHDSLKKEGARIGPAAAVQDLFERVRPHLVIMSRFASVEGLEIEKAAKQRSIPVVYHIDDDLLNPPESLGPTVYARHPADVRERRARFMENASLIYASTPKLWKVLEKRFPQQKFFTGIYCSLVPPIAEPSSQTQPFKIGYMGSAGHVNDLATTLPTIERLLSENSGVVFELFGTIPFPETLSKFRERVRYHKPAANYEEFIAKLKTLNWNVGLAPLEINEFNLCKAPTKFIEYSSAGIATVATRCETYSIQTTGGAAVLVDQDGWYPALLELLNSPIIACAHAKDAAAFCKSTYPRHELAKQLLKLDRLVQELV